MLVEFVPAFVLGSLSLSVPPLPTCRLHSHRSDSRASPLDHSLPSPCRSERLHSPPTTGFSDFQKSLDPPTRPEAAHRPSSSTAVRPSPTRGPTAFYTLRHC